MTDAPDELQRWTAKRKAAVVMSIVKGEASAAEAARNYGLTVAEIERRIRRNPQALGGAVLRRRRKRAAIPPAR